MAYWKLDELSGAAIDSAGGANGIVTDTTRGVTGIANTAYQFSGNPGSIVSVPNTTTLQIGDTVTLEAWARRTLDALDFIVLKGGDWTGGNTNYGMALHSSANDWGLLFTFNGGWRRTPGPSDFDWHHYVVVARDGDANPLMYIDGVQKSVTASYGPAAMDLYSASNLNLQIGSQDDSYRYWGAAAVDEVAIYDYALSPERIEAHYTMGSGLPATPYGVGHTLGENTPSCKCADPVNTSTGNFTYEHQDLYVPSRGFPFDMRRVYNSLETRPSSLGVGWAGTYAMTATATTSDTIYITNEDGRWDKYVPSGGGYIADAGANATLTKTVDSIFLTRPDQTEYGFDLSNGKLKSITDKNGDAMAFGPIVGGTQTVTDTVGRLYTFKYDGQNRLVGIVDPASRTITYTYNVTGDLTSFVDPNGGTITYVYDTAHHLVNVIDQNGTTVVTNTYNIRGRVLQQTDARGYTQTLSYDTASRATTHTDALGYTRAVCIRI